MKLLQLIILYEIGVLFYKIFLKWSNRKNRISAKIGVELKLGCGVEIKLVIESDIEFKIEIVLRLKIQVVVQIGVKV